MPYCGWLLAQVNIWLQKTFGGDEVPQYEITPRTVNVLYDLMQRNEWQDKCAGIITDDLRQKAEEYNAEG